MLSCHSIRPRSIPGHRDRIVVIDILLIALDALAASAKDPIPETRLLAVVAALLPALAVMKIVILDDEFRIEHSQEPAQCVGRRGEKAQSTVASQFGEDDVLVADPPLVESHRHTHQFHSKICHEGDARDVEKLLLMVGVQRKEWVGVLGQVVGAVVFPETVHLVHQAVVPIEPEVEDDTIQANLQRKPHPADR